ncbi:cell division control protein [Pelomyxa schiedti]|nr:cell division control protein [Pelomyxa schiedti]
MVRFATKGGIWKNTEDEILKAAVMKYGKNQWARISSLLVRKSAKQCKARWQEWLDPSIKKTEWSREEEEKLLHLAKVMPTQWRTIAPLVGRTAYQCFEHYNKLLDAAQAKDGTYDPADDPRRLRPGEIDPLPECKPARSDPIDMDEDEKEMLSEARARLANTKGKKAKRKAREKQLDEARRLATLQKRRELKAAGINMSFRTKMRGMIDYNNEIPFHRSAPKGFYDVPQEEDKKHVKPDFKSTLLEKVEGPRRAEVEGKKRKDDMTKHKEKEKKDVPAAVMQMNKSNDPSIIRKKSKLALPEPQISEKELEELSKLGEDAESLERQLAHSKGQATSALIANYATTPGATPMASPSSTPTLRNLASRTPQRTPLTRDTLMMEAENLIKLTQSQTPLHGGENPELHPSDFSGVTPKREDIKTPNVLTTPQHQVQGGATPAHNPANTAAPSTPLRDQFNINSDEALETAQQQLQQLQLVPSGSTKQRQLQLQQQLQQQLSLLPAPKYTYQIACEDPDKVKKEKSSKADRRADDSGEEGESAEEDAADEASRLEEEERQRELALIARCSSVLQRSLPRASTFNLVNTSDNSDPLSNAEFLIQQEMANMIKYEADRFPLPGASSAPAKPPSHPLEHEFPLDITAEEFEQANDMLRKYAKVEKSSPDLGEFRKLWEQCHSDIVLLDGKYVRLSKAQTSDKIAAYSSMHEVLKKQLSSESRKLSKLENRVVVYNGGYQSRTSSLLRDTTQLHARLCQSAVEKECFSSLRHSELEAMPARLKHFTREIERQQDTERQLQSRYAALQSRATLLKKEIAQLKQPLQAH